MKHWLQTPAGLVPVLLAVMLVYLNAFSGAFQFDDYNVIVNNPRVHSWTAWWVDAGHGIRPLLKFSYTMDWTLGLGVFGFHLSNLLIHFANIWLVWQLSRKFIAAQPALQDRHTLPLLVAMLFALHPAHSEAITYISGRSSALMTLFYLAGLLLYAVGRESLRGWMLHVTVPLAMLLALATKETAVTFPLALLLWEWCCGGSLRQAWRRQWSSWLLLLLGAIFFFWHTAYQQEMATSAALNSLSGNLATQALAFVYLLRQWLLPLWLNIDPDLPVVRDWHGVMPQLVLLLAALMLALYWLRRRPWLGFALGWAIVHLLPLYVLLPRLDVANERQLYLLGWPLALGVLAELSCWLQARTLHVATGILLVLLGALTIQRNAEYRSEVTLWEATVRHSPRKARVRNNLGYAYLLAGRTEEARTQFVIALQLDPRYYKARYNLMSMSLSDD